MKNKHPHHDLIVELIGDTSKQALQVTALGHEVNTDIAHVADDVAGMFEFKIKPREFIKGHWYPCVDKYGDKMALMFNGDSFSYYIGKHCRKEMGYDLQFIGKSLGEIKFGGDE